MTRQRATVFLCSLTAMAAVRAVEAHASSSEAQTGLVSAQMPGGIGVLDLVFIAFAVYVVWRWFSNAARRKKDDDDTIDVTPTREDGEAPPQEHRSRAAQAAWEYLTGEKGPDIHPEDEQDKKTQEARQADPPGTFNEREFLRGAKIIYGRIRQSLAMRNMADLRQFASPDMMRRFEQMAQEKPDRETVAVMLVEATVLKVVKEDKQTVVDVAYEATISDDPKTNASRKVNEVWRFVRDDTVTDGKWLLESMDTAS
ncbi:MAG: TIM44-like domain-containing protein [Acidobacteriota bacterium]